MSVSDSGGKGVTFPDGFLASGIACGIKPDGRPDLALVVSEETATAAGVFTTNRIQAAPVRVSRIRIEQGRARAVVLNSGNANACTGERGMEDALRTTTIAAERLGILPEEVLVCSTGPIGVPLPVERIVSALPEAVERLDPDGGPAAAAAILTTDTKPKESGRSISTGEGEIRIGGMAKGAGMICPGMATMLAVITTDATIDAPDLQRWLREIVDGTFNRITVDGDRSTNDTVLVLANGWSGVRADPGTPAGRKFREALFEVCSDLARRIVADGEGATKLVTVRVTGAADPADAERAARAVAGSMLVKCSWFGGDPNWGRILDAVGYCGAELDPDRVAVWFDEIAVAAGGRAVGEEAAEAARAAAARREFSVRVDLGRGASEAVVLTTDLSPEYVRINAEH